MHLWRVRELGSADSLLNYDGAEFEPVLAAEPSFHPRPSRDSQARWDTAVGLLRDFGAEPSARRATRGDL
jgi:hypothetical protein